MYVKTFLHNCVCLRGEREREREREKAKERFTVCSWWRASKQEVGSGSQVFTKVRSRPSVWMERGQREAAANRNSRNPPRQLSVCTEQSLHMQALETPQHCLHPVKYSDVNSLSLSLVCLQSLYFPKPSPLLWHLTLLNTETHGLRINEANGRHV